MHHRKPRPNPFVTLHECSVMEWVTPGLTVMTCVTGSGHLTVDLSFHLHPFVWEQGRLWPNLSDSSLLAYEIPKSHELTGLQIKMATNCA